MFDEGNEPEKRDILMIQELGTKSLPEQVKRDGIESAKEQKLEEQGWMLAGWYI